MNGDLYSIYEMERIQILLGDIFSSLYIFVYKVFLEKTNLHIMLFEPPGYDHQLLS